MPPYNWFDVEMQQLEDDFEDGYISYAQYENGMNELLREAEESGEFDDYDSGNVQHRDLW